MEKALPKQTSGTSFYTILKFTVPGTFLAFWWVLFAFRLAHPPDPKDIYQIACESDLLSFLHTFWSGIVGIVISFGAFLGIILVGLEPIIRAFMGSRILDFAFKSLLSSKKVDFVYFQFLRLHDVLFRYDRLPKKLAERLIPDSLRIQALANGDYSNKYFFRETLQNYFWHQCLDKEEKSELSSRWELGSMFLYLSFVSLLLFVFQIFFYIEHVTSPASYYFLSLDNLSRLDSLFSFNTIPLLLLGYIFLSMIFNAFSKEKKNGFSTVEHVGLVEKLRSLWRSERKFMIGLSVSVYIGFCYLFASRMRSLTWLEPLDIVLFCFFFVSFVGFYWSGAFQLSRYEICFEHHFKKHERKIADFAIENSALILEMDREFGRKPQRETKVQSKSKVSYVCKSCDTVGVTAYFCPNCNSSFCSVCSLHNCLKCPSCDLELRRQHALSK